MSAKLELKKGDRVCIEGVVNGCGDHWVFTIGDKVHHMTEFKNGEEVEVTDREKWLERPRKSKYAAFVNGVHYCYSNYDNTLVPWKRVRRPQRKRTVELSDERIKFAKDFAKRVDLPADEYLKLCQEIAEQCDE